MGFSYRPCPIGNDHFTRRNVCRFHWRDASAAPSTHAGESRLRHTRTKPECLHAPWKWPVRACARATPPRAYVPRWCLGERAAEVGAEDWRGLARHADIPALPIAALPIAPRLSSGLPTIDRATRGRAPALCASSKWKPARHLAAPRDVVELA